MMATTRKFVTVDALPKMAGAPLVVGIAVNVPKEKLLSRQEAEELVEELWDAIRDLTRVEKALGKVRT